MFYKKPFQKLILASKSPRRADILRRLNFQFSQSAPLFDEKQCDKLHLTPGMLPLVLAEKKALSLVAHHQDDIIVGCDTIVMLEGDVMEKPVDIMNAFEMLKKLSGKTHQVITGVSLILKSHFIKCNFVDTSYVTFKNLTDSTINSYFKSVNPLDKAGGYAIQKNGDLIIKSIKGSFDNVVGFPSAKFSKSIRIINEYTQGY